LNPPPDAAKLMIVNWKIPPLLAPFCALMGIIGLMALTAWAETSQQAQSLPTPFPEVRYQHMSTKSPFAVASATGAATAAPTPGFAAQLYVNGVVHLGRTDYAAIKSRDPDQLTAVFLAVGETSPDGLKVEKIHWSDEMGKSTVDVSKNGEKATLIFDEQQMAKNAPPVPAGMPGQPGVRMPIMPGQRPVGFPLQNRGFQQPGNFNGRPFPQPGQPAVQPGVEGTPGMPNGIQMRRRVRTIQSGQ
jgi:hypothetical protein